MKLCYLEQYQLTLPFQVFILLLPSAEYLCNWAKIASYISSYYHQDYQYLHLFVSWMVKVYLADVHESIILCCADCRGCWGLLGGQSGCDDRYCSLINRFCGFPCQLIRYLAGAETSYKKTGTDVIK